MDTNKTDKYQKTLDALQAMYIGAGENITETLLTYAQQPRVSTVLQMWNIIEVTRGQPVKWLAGPPSLSLAERVYHAANSKNYRAKKPVEKPKAKKLLPAQPPQIELNLDDCAKKLIAAGWKVLRPTTSFEEYTPE